MNYTAATVSLISASPENRRGFQSAQQKRPFKGWWSVGMAERFAMGTRDSRGGRSPTNLIQTPLYHRHLNGLLFVPTAQIVRLFFERPSAFWSQKNKKTPLPVASFVQRV
jgi:hypothetical protein